MLNNLTLYAGAQETYCAQAAQADAKAFTTYAFTRRQGTSAPFQRVSQTLAEDNRQGGRYIMAKLNDMTAPSKEAKTFDDWFFKQPKKAQDKMRDNGVLPYCDMVPSKHVFDIDPNHPAWAHMDTPNVRTEVDSFISRDHVGVMLKAFIDAIAYSNNFEFRRHVELVRWALSLPGCLDSRTIGKMHGISHFTMIYRAKKIKRLVNSDACGLFPHVNVRRDKHRPKCPQTPKNPP